jgi:hypothetical protein
VLLPERRGVTPSAYNFLVGLHQRKYTCRTVDGAGSTLPDTLTSQQSIRRGILGTPSWALIVAVQAAISFRPRPIHAGVRLFSAVGACAAEMNAASHVNRDVHGAVSSRVCLGSLPPCGLASLVRYNQANDQRASIALPFAGT